MIVVTGAAGFIGFNIAKRLNLMGIDDLILLDDKENYRKFCEKIPVGRFGETNEILTSVAFLASRYSSYVTGADIKVDGGWTIY